VKSRVGSIEKMTTKTFFVKRDFSDVPYDTIYRLLSNTAMHRIQRWIFFFLRTFLFFMRREKMNE